MNIIRTLGNRLLVQAEPVQRFEGRFLLHDKYYPEQRIARILQVGSKVTLPVTAGEKVLIDQYYINDRTYTAPNQFIVSADHVALAFP